MDECIIKSPLGYTKIIGDVDGISSVKVLDNIEPSEDKSANLSFLRKQESEEKITDVIPMILEDCVFQLQEYFEGLRTEFDLKLNPEGTHFQKQVWKLLEHIPYGKTVSYLDLAKQMDDVKAFRAVANANAKNPLWIIVPCHRVIGTDGSLTGYAGGLHRKQWLLNHENPFKQQSLF